MRQTFSLGGYAARKTQAQEKSASNSFILWPIWRGFLQYMLEECGVLTKQKVPLPKDAPFCHDALHNLTQNPNCADGGG